MYKGRTKKCEVQWASLVQTLAQKFGANKSGLLLELQTTEPNDSMIWMELEEEDDLTEGCLLGLVEVQ